MSNSPTTALVLSGGGARGAYQVGVLLGLVDLGVVPDGFQILVGSSAGSINACALAAQSSSFPASVGKLERVWGGIKAEQVFRTDVRSVGSTGVRWAWDLTLGGILGGVTPKSLLDTAPLRRLLQRVIPFAQIQRNVLEGKVQALAIAATDLYSAEGVMFVQSARPTRLWRRRRWRVLRAEIGLNHVLASSAIPIFFPSVEIDGRYFGDGCIRNSAPLRPAIHLGAQRIVAIGVRGPQQPWPVEGPPSVAQIASVLMDAVMMDSVETDVEHSQHISQSVLACRTAKCGNPLRSVDVLWLSPSQAIASIAAQLEDRMPAVIRYLMRGLGKDSELSELSSYLLFDSVFCQRLMQLGRDDVLAARERILDFFASPVGQPVSAAS